MKEWAFCTEDGSRPRRAVYIIPCVSFHISALTRTFVEEVHGNFGEQKRNLDRFILLGEKLIKVLRIPIDFQYIYKSTITPINPFFMTPHFNLITLNDLYDENTNPYQIVVVVYCLHLLLFHPSHLID